jgi:AcrR family transcriptional regulator
MLAASIDVLAEAGWGGFSLHRIAEVMGTSEQPVRTRAESVSDLAAQVWTDRLAHGFTSDLEHLDAVKASSRIVDAVGRLLDRSPQAAATGELLVVSCFDDGVHSAVDATLGQTARALITQRDEAAARSAFALALGIGVLFMSRRPDASTWHLDDALLTRARALGAAATSKGVPDIAAPHMEDSPLIAPEDPALQALLTSCLTLVSTRGYDNVTVRHIAKDAGYTEGLIYARYRSKKEMFLDAVRRQQQAGWELNAQYVARLEANYGLAMAEAIQWQQFQRPRSRLGRAMALEQLRMTWHDASLMDAYITDMASFRASLLSRPGWAEFETEGDFILNVAVPYGLYWLAFFVPGVDRLPYDAVTVPLYREFERQAGHGDGRRAGATTTTR